MGCVVESVECLRQFTVMILHSVTFINDHVLPPKLGKHRPVLDNILVGREEHIQLRRLHLVLNDAANGWGAFIGYNLHMKKYLLTPMRIQIAMYIVV